MGWPSGLKDAPCPVRLDWSIMGCTIRLRALINQLFTCRMVSPVSWASCFFCSSEGYGCERCWNNQALMMLVATLGKIPLFLFRLRSRSRSSSSPAELGEATLVSSPSPWSLELSPLWEARPPLDGPGVPKCTDPLSSWSLIHVVFHRCHPSLSSSCRCPSLELGAGVAGVGCRAQGL